MIGQQVSHYEIISRLGTGGMGEVYEARDHRLGRRVALKFLPQDLSRDARAVERLQREARIASSLNHPHICTIHDIDSHHGMHFIVMELLDGLPLKHRIMVGPIGAAELVQITMQVAEALDVAHKLGIVHRDIKPPNIFLTARGPVKVLDFGVAKLQIKQPDWGLPPTMLKAPPPEQDALPTPFGIARIDPTEVRPSDALTTDGMALGTVQYMSPEQARGEEIDARSDLFSLGVVMYEMATGIPAFTGSTNALVYDAIQHRQPAPPSTVSKAMPVEMDRVIGRLLEKDREKRYQTAADLMADLQRVRRHAAGEVPFGRTAEYPTRFEQPASARLPRARGPVGRFRALSRALQIGVPVVVIAGLLAAGMMWRSQQAHALVERDAIVVGDFTNTTGDPAFDAALRQAVDVQLQQSRWFSVVPEERTAATLGEMRRPLDTPLLGEVAHELCQRAGARAVIDGTIATAGSTYAMTLEAQHCPDGYSLGREEAQATGKDDVLDQLGAATTRLRKQLGESQASLERFDTPIHQATTASLPALKSYSLGMRARARSGESSAIPFLRQAIEIDPAFALAHARLSAVYENLGDRQLARDEAQKAHDLRDKVSEYERLSIVTRFHDVVTGDADKRLDTLRLMSDTFPRDFAPRNTLGVAYLELGRVDRALEQFRQAAQLAPAERLPAMNLANTLAGAGRLDDAKAAFEKALAIGDSSETRAGAYLRAYLAGDRDEMMRHYEAGRRGGEPWLLSSARALSAAAEGHVAEARQIVSQGISEAAGAKRPGAVARGWLQLAFISLQAGDEDIARTAAGEALTSDRDARAVLQAATVLALAGEAARAAQLTAPFERSPSTPPGQLTSLGTSPQLDTVTRDVFLQQALAARLLAGGKAAEAQALLERSASYDPRYPELTWLRGRARLAARHAGAAADFRTLLDNRWRGGMVIYPIAELDLARALAQTGDATGARAAYDRFLTAWANADPDLVPLDEARKERDALAAPTAPPGR